MKAFFAFASLCLLANCDGPAPGEVSPLNALEINASIIDAKRYLGNEASVIAVCGPSIGVGLYLDALEDGYAPDGISDGVIIFAKQSDGTPALLRRDATKELIVVSEQGGQVSALPAKDDARLGIWIIKYPTTQVVETHNLVLNSEGHLFDLWTANKASVAPLPARTLSFHSRCEFQS